MFLRVKPQTEEEKQIWETSKTRKRASMEEEEDPESMVKIESGHQVAVTAPRESNTYKNSMNGAGKLVHRYTFTRIFPPQTEQQELFTSMVLPRVQAFLEGQNQLLFTYGASSSGKTYTIQGWADLSSLSLLKSSFTSFLRVNGEIDGQKQFQIRSQIYQT